MDKYLLDQIWAKVLFIREILYLEYKLLLIFDNITSYVIYAKNILHITYINKRLKSQQPFLQASWYKKIEGEIIIQKTYILSANLAISQSNRI